MCKSQYTRIGTCSHAQTARRSIRPCILLPLHMRLTTPIVSEADLTSRLILPKLTYFSGCPAKITAPTRGRTSGKNSHNRRIRKELRFYAYRMPSLIDRSTFPFLPAHPGPLALCHRILCLKAGIRPLAKRKYRPSNPLQPLLDAGFFPPIRLSATPNTSASENRRAGCARYLRQVG